MGIELRLGRSDHKVVEDYVAGRPAHVSAAIFDVRYLKLQSGAIEAARANGTEVVIETLTERLTEPEFAPGLLATYGDGTPLDPNLLTGLSERSDWLSGCLSPSWQWRPRWSHRIFSLPTSRLFRPLWRSPR